MVKHLLAFAAAAVIALCTSCQKNTNDSQKKRSYDQEQPGQSKQPARSGYNSDKEQGNGYKAQSSKNGSSSEKMNGSSSDKMSKEDMDHTMSKDKDHKDMDDKMKDEDKKCDVPCNCKCPAKE